MTTLIIALTLGLVAGFIGSLFGIGGGLIMVPCFIYILKLPYPAAVATSLVVIIGVSLSSSINNLKSTDSLIDFPIAIACLIGAIISAWIGAHYLKIVPPQYLQKGFAILMIIAGIRILFN